MRALAVLLVALGSDVALETSAVLMIQPLPLPVTDVVIVNEAVAFAASEASSQRTMRVAIAYVQPGAEENDSRDGSVSVRTTFCAESGPRLRA